MTTPRRLLGDENAAPHARALIEDWIENERPSADARAKTLAAVSAATAMGAASGVGIAGSAASKLTASASVISAKWVALLVLVAGGYGAALALRTEARIATPNALDAPAAPSSPAPVGSEAHDVSRPPIATVDVEELPTDPPIAVVRPPRVRVPDKQTPPSMRAPSLDEELAALGAARALLSGGDAAGALQRLDAYEARFAPGALLQEAEVLRIEALVRRADEDGAQRAAGRFFARFPESPHVARVRELLRSAE